MKEIVLATKNPDKLRELAHALQGLPIKVLSHDEVGGWDEVEETGETLVENALLKARVVSAVTGRTCLADDTGLEVDALDGEPGVMSARFAGENATYADNVKKLLDELYALPEAQRTARFRCVIAIVDPESGEETTVEGAVQGWITNEPRGKGGFGYDPVFMVADLDHPRGGRTFAEMSLEEKKDVSHRGRALVAARAVLESWYGGEGPEL